MKLSNLMGVDTYKEAIKEVQLSNDVLQERLCKANRRIAELEKQLQLYKADDEEKLDILREDVKGLEETYMKRIAEAENMIALAKADCDMAEKKLSEIKQVEHRAFAEGRMSAYSEMGIWNINAHTRGNILVRDDDGEVYEMIRGKLYDVDDDIDIEAAAVKIDDLLEGVDTE